MFSGEHYSLLAVIIQEKIIRACFAYFEIKSPENPMSRSVRNSGRPFV